MQRRLRGLPGEQGTCTLPSLQSPRPLPLVFFSISCVNPRRPRPWACPCPLCQEPRHDILPHVCLANAKKAGSRETLRRWPGWAGWEQVQALSEISDFRGFVCHFFFFHFFFLPTLPTWCKNLTVRSGARFLLPPFPDPSRWATGRNPDQSSISCSLLRKPRPLSVLQPTLLRE